jgi:hypothetical protein
MSSGAETCGNALQCRTSNIKEFSCAGRNKAELVLT